MLRQRSPFGLAAEILVAVLAVSGVATAGEVDGVHNGTFELGRSPDGTRPAQWYVGFPGEGLAAPGAWTLVDDDGGTALQIRADSDDGYYLSQLVDLPAGAMAGVTVTVGAMARVAEGDGWAVVQLVALNPEAPVDPDTGIAEVGHVVVGTSSGSWERIQGSVTLSGPAELLALVVSAAGAGTVAELDDVAVTAPLDPPGAGPDPSSVDLPASGPPPFPLGVTDESPRNASDAGRTDLVHSARRRAGLVNLFVHVRWNALAGRPLLDGHDRALTTTAELDRFAVPRMLTFDFTHASLEGLGDVNPLPDGTPAGRLDDPSVAEAYLDELLALAAVIRPRIVSVGIETDFFWQAHRDQWPAFRTMVCTARERLRALDPEVHVTTYFTLPTLVRPDGSPDADGQAALQELEPCIDSVGFSTYPADGVHHLDALPAGFFAAAADVDPALPLIVPECGFPTGGIYSEAEQAEFLRRLLDELAGHPTLAVVWYSLYDQTYLGVAPWFQDAFRTIGLHQLDWTPKAAAALMRRLHTLQSLRHPAGRVGPVHMRIDGRHLQPPGG